MSGMTQYNFFFNNRTVAFSVNGNVRFVNDIHV